MTPPAATDLLRPGVLDGFTVVLAGDGILGAAAAEACARAGARIADGEPRDADGLIVDTSAAFGAGGHDGLRAGLDGAFSATRSVARAAWIDPGRPGRVLLLAPAADAGPYATALRAGLENLARTLSTEWARHAITVVAVLAGSRGGPDDVAQLCAYLASPAGAYHAGCAFTLA